MLNITVTNTSGPGWFAAWKVGEPYPGTSTLNWISGGQTIANLTLVKLVATGVLLRKIRGKGVNTMDLIIDLVAYSILTA